MTVFLDEFIHGFSKAFPGTDDRPWEITGNLQDIIKKLIPALDENYLVNDGIAIHKTATVEPGAILKAPIIISEHCFIGAHSYLRGGVFLAGHVSVGPGCEIKTSIMLEKSKIAHFNFIGDSIIGHAVNIEAGAVIANHWNEKMEKTISVIYNGKVMSTGSQKFGAVVGDNSKIGANAVLSPGTLLPANSIVSRLELVDQSA